jgi:hypothetical protein
LEKWLFELGARFPRQLGEVPKDAIRYLARQLRVSPSDLAGYPWTGRTIEHTLAHPRTYQLRGLTGSPTWSDMHFSTNWSKSTTPTESVETQLGANGHHRGVGDRPDDPRVP